MSNRLLNAALPWQGRVLVDLGLVYLALSSVLRLVLWLVFGLREGVGPVTFLGVFVVGILDDAVVALYLLLPVAVWLALVPSRWYRSRIFRGLSFLLGAGLIFGWIYATAIEYFFFSEFNARLNLVAVDYLMYPHEVLINIWDSYPVLPVLLVTGAAALGLAALLRRRIREDVTAAVSWRWRFGLLFAPALVVTLAASSCSTRSFAAFENRVAGELAINGVSSFFEALRTNEIDYDANYRSADREAMYELLTRSLAASGTPLTAVDEHRLDRRFAAHPGGLSDGPVNVVMILEESLGAEFSAAYGAPRGLTPELDAIAARGLRFTRAYATGTRTVRGLEAVVASFPPIPSVAIVRRPGNEGIATWGQVMRERGYQTLFLYGGFSYFDNMEHFFASNGFLVKDRAEIDDPVFANIWGVSDEDLFAMAASTFDEVAAQGKPFFSVVLTTSNHKPFTFRPGVPGVPEEGGGREAGVRYADFALGRFLRDAESHPWFERTLFVIAGDHGARVYGAAQIPLPSYEIPIVVYAPALLEPRQVDTLMSQIDIAPTVLGMLGEPFVAPFFGQDVLAPGLDPDRVLLFNHNHDVALMRGRDMVVLGLHQTVEGYRVQAGGALEPEPPAPDLVDLATAYYQTAYDQFQNRTYR